MVSGSQALKLFRSSELELVVCGKMDLDVSVLRSVCQYDGYESTDRIIGWYGHC